MCIMLYGSLYYLLSLYSNLQACQGPKSREADNSIKVTGGGILHTSKGVLWELARGRMCSSYLGSKKDVTDLKATFLLLNYRCLPTMLGNGRIKDPWYVLYASRGVL
jgi:hypothetical protein